jgi:ribonuclease HII
MKITDFVLDYAPREYSDLEFVCGIDECGRGCGSGPVTTASVILPKGFSSPLIRDSKKLTEKQRNEAYKLIMENAIAVSCNHGSVFDINEMGIDKTTFKTMYKCLSELEIKPQHILIDGISWETYNDEEDINDRLTLVPKGDDTYTSIAAAAIVAKVTRDAYMTELHENYTEYNWKKNKGYLTADHILGIKNFGATIHHRSKYIRNFLI